jgi:YHS domain-containing protein
MKQKMVILKNKHMKTLILVLLSIMSFSSWSQETAAGRQKHFNTFKNHLAIQGYDPVAYFTEGKGVKGSGNYRAEVNGIIYHFSTEANRDLFQKNPSKYEPQYGGWCAYAMGNDGDKVAINPSTFKIVNGKLYLFYNKGGENTRVYWNDNQDEQIKTANANWKKIVG